MTLLPLISYAPVRIATILLLALLPHALCAGDIETIKTEAENGDGVAQLLLSERYYKGEGVPQDYKEAYIWHLMGVASQEAEFKDLGNNAMAEAHTEFIKTMESIAGQKPSPEETAKAQAKLKTDLEPLTNLKLSPEGIARLQENVDQRLNETQTKLESMLFDATKNGQSPDEVAKLKGLLADVKKQRLQQNEVAQNVDSYSEMVAKLKEQLTPNELAEAEAEARKRANNIHQNR